MEKICLSCEYYRVKDVESGICRVLVKETGDRNADKPRVLAESTCGKWADSGQQYYIRKGWIRGQQEKTP